VTISTMTLSEAAALVPMTADRLGHWAETGHVAGATRKGKHCHWSIDRQKFMDALPALQETLRCVDEGRWVDRSPVTGMPALGLTCEVTDAVRLLPTVEQAMASQCRMPWWSWERAWSLPSVVIALVSFVFGMFVR
jgi:hypothetical protein